MTSQILNYSDEDFRQLAKKIIEDGSVVLHEQNLTRAQHVEVCERIGECEKQGYWMNPKEPVISWVWCPTMAANNLLGKIQRVQVGFRL